MHLANEETGDTGLNQHFLAEVLKFFYHAVCECQTAEVVTVFPFVICNLCAKYFSFGSGIYFQALSLYMKILFP